MKKTLRSGSMGFVLTAALLGACRKDNIPQQKTSPNRHEYQASVTAKTIDPEQFEPNKMSWPERVIGYDEADAEFRKAKLFYALGLREIVKDSTIAHWIFNRAKKAENNVIFLDEVFSEFPGTRELVASVQDPLGRMTGWNLEQVTAKMQYDNYHIKPAIYLMNAEHADGSFKPLVTPGDDLDVDDEQHGDVVLAWHLSNNNQATAVNLWEELAQRLESPVLCIDGVATNLKELEQETPLPTAKTTEYFPISDYPNMRLTMTRFRIGYRYDVGNNSELRLVARCIMLQNPEDPETEWKWKLRNFFRENCFTKVMGGNNFEITKVHKRDIGKTLSIDRFFAKAQTPWPLDLAVGEYDHYMLSTPSGPRLMNRKSLAFNLYEHDGFASLKKLMRIQTDPGRTEEVEGRMTKYNEWYLFNPNDYFQAYAVTLPYPYIGWIHDEDHAKGDMRLMINKHCTY